MISAIGPSLNPRQFAATRQPPIDAVGALAPEAIADAPKPPWDITGTWLHGGGPNNPWQFSPPEGFKLTPEAQVFWDGTQAAAAKGKVYQDDIGQCWPAGLPIIMTCRRWMAAFLMTSTPCSWPITWSMRLAGTSISDELFSGISKEKLSSGTS